MRLIQGQSAWKMERLVTHRHLLMRRQVVKADRVSAALALEMFTLKTERVVAPDDGPARAAVATIRRRHGLAARPGADRVSH